MNTRRTTHTQSESVEARSLAYDKPSDKFLPFLARHFNLRRFIPQANNYVVFLDHPTLQEAAREHALAQQAASGRGRPRHVPVGSRNQEAAAAAVTNDTTGGESAPVDVATQQAARRSAASQYFANQIIWPGDPRSNFDLPLPRRYGQDRLGGADRNGADGLTPLRLVTADLPSVRTSFAEEEAAERARRQVAASQAVEEHVMEQKSSRQLFDVEKVLDNVRRKLHPETEVNLRYERFIVDNNGKAIDGRGR